jgi:ankyrin repeat protein
MLAALAGHLSVVQALLAAGADVDAANHTGYTALMWAALKGHLAVVQALSEAEANLNAENEDGLTALLLALSNAPLSVVEALFEAGADEEGHIVYEVMKERCDMAIEEERERFIAAERSPFFGRWLPYFPSA